MKKCSDCKHQQVQAETIKYWEAALDEEGRALPVPPNMHASTYPSVERCRADFVKPYRHPFGLKGRGPVLTCREMRLNECGKEGKLFEARIVFVAPAPSAPRLHEENRKDHDGMKRTHLGRPRNRKEKA